MKFCLFTAFAFLSINLFCQENWTLSKEVGDIKVYTRKLADHKFEQVKIVAQIKSSIKEIVAILEDIPGQKDWVYATKDVYKISEGKEAHSVNYYLSMDMPFPSKDRDVIINYTRHQDPETLIVLTQSQVTSDLVKPFDKMERIRDFKSTYKLTPITDELTEVIYHLNADPGGTLPAWIVNMFTTKGPYQTMMDLKKKAESGAYRDVELEDIRNFTSNDQQK